MNFWIGLISSPEMGTRYFKSSAAPATATCPKK